MTAPPFAVDLCCGAGGVTAGMLAAGFEVLGVDTVARRDYPAPLLRQDVRTVDPARLGRPVWLHASPPCERFSNARATRLRDPPTEADLDVLRACLAIRDALQPRLWTVENVQGAVRWFEPFLGPPRLQHGPFFLWGNFPPFLTASSGLKKGIEGAVGKGGQRGRDRHRSPWLRARVPFELAGPLARACADALAAAPSSGRAGP